MLGYDGWLYHMPVLVSRCLCFIFFNATCRRVSIQSRCQQLCGGYSPATCQWHTPHNGCQPLPCPDACHFEKDGAEMSPVQYLLPFNVTLLFFCLFYRISRVQGPTLMGASCATGTSAASSNKLWFLKVKIEETPMQNTSSTIKLFSLIHVSGMYMLSRMPSNVFLGPLLQQLLSFESSEYMNKLEFMTKWEVAMLFPRRPCIANESWMGLYIALSKCSRKKWSETMLSIVMR